MIKRFHVENYKALRDVTLDLRPFHVLIGQNDTGKTSILEALTALCRSVDHPLSAAFTGSWTNHDLVWRGDSDLRVGLEALVEEDLATSSYRIECSFGRQGRTAKLYIEALQGVPSDDRSFSGGDKGHPQSGVYRVAFEGQHVPSINKSGAEFAFSMLKGLQYYRWDPRMLALPVAPSADRQCRMESCGFGLAACLEDILGDDRDRFNALESRFKAVFPQFDLIKLLRQPAYASPVDDPEQILKLQPSPGKGIFFRFTDSGQVISASQVSDGVMLVLAYLTILHLPEQPRVVLVEEPENGVHPERLKQVLQILRQLVEEQEHTQVLMTTHSPYVVDLFKPEEVTLCLRNEDEGDISVHRLSESETVREQMKVFTLGEIWTSEGDDALGKSTKSSEAPKS